MKIKAIKPCHYYGGRNVGDVFDADDRWGHMLIRMGRAEAHEEGAKAVKAAKEAATKDMHAEGEDKPAKRAYKRKDMHAEGDTK